MSSNSLSAGLIEPSNSHHHTHRRTMLTTRCQHGASMCGQSLLLKATGMIINGSCCCGSVHFRIEGKPSLMGTCHCSRCRKLGTSTIVFVRREQFTLTHGEADIVTVAPQAPYKYVRSFCRKCGTSLGEPLSPDGSFPINAQCLDDDPAIRNTFVEHVSDLPAWLNPALNLQQTRDLQHSRVEE